MPSRTNHGFIRPGTALMNRLRYPQKFALICLLFILPLALVILVIGGAMMAFLASNLKPGNDSDE